MTVLKYRKGSRTHDTINYETANTKIFYEKSIPFWKKIFHLPADGVWYTSILILAYVSVIVNLYMTPLAKCIDVWSGWSGLCYSLDVIYFIDVVLSIGSIYIPNLDVPEINLSARSIPIFVVDIISLLPIEAFMPTKTFQQRKTFCVMRINRCIRIVRIIYFKYKYYQQIDSKIYMQVLHMYSCLSVLILSAYAVYCNILCFQNICEKSHFCHGYIMVQTVILKLCSGFTDIANNLIMEFISVIAMLINFYFLYLVMMTHFTISLINLFRHQVLFINKYNSVCKRITFHKLPESIKNMFMNYYNLVWQYREGRLSNEMPSDILPSIMYNELMIDITWPTFRHTKLFKYMSLSFLRHLSSHIKFVYMAPGEYVTVRNQWKDKMIYLVFGTIELLSLEDGESPILTLNAGTCLGESCLIVSYKSKNSVRCKTYCEFHVIKKKSILKMEQKFPEECKTLRDLIKRRYDEIKAFHDVANLAKSKALEGTRPTDRNTLLWLKNILHSLMAKDDESTFRHSFQNIYLNNEISTKSNDKLLFLADYLDLYVVGERTEIDTDTLFVQTSCPCVLQPNSLIVYIWEAVVIIFTVLLSFSIPYMSFIYHKDLISYTVFVQVSTLIFWFDLYVQLSTAVRTREGVTTKLKSAAIAKIQTIGFWADILSCIPCEMFTSTILENITSQTKARMHMNRTIKLWRLERLFRLWEKKFNVNVIIIRFVKFSWINLYSIFIFYCKLYNDKSGSDLQIIYTAAQIISGVGLADSIESHEQDIFYNLTDIISTFINVIMFANIMSGYVMVFLDRFDVQGQCFDLVNLITAKQLDSFYSVRIHNFVNTRMEESGGVHFTKGRVRHRGIPAVIYHTSLKHMGYKVLKALTFFQYLPDVFILDVCTVMAISMLPPNEMIAHVGDVSSDIYILYTGFCEVLNANNVSENIINSYLPINLIEVFLNIPLVNTYITRTHCVFFELPHETFMKILMKYPDHLRHIKNAVASSSNIRQKLMELTVSENKIKKSPLSQMSQPSFYKFGYNHQIDSFEEYDYFIPFDRLYPFSIIKYLLMRVTILPNGKFFFVWEIFRCCFAILSSIFYFVIPLIKSDYSTVLLILDFAAVLDIYIRLHVCFYDDNGLLIKHPLKTSIHYLLHGFHIDFLAVFPFELFVSSNDSILFFIIRMNRLLQLHRYYSFTHHILKVSIKPVNKMFGVVYIPFILVLCNFFGSLLIRLECKFIDDPNKTANFYKGITCKNDSILLISNFSKPIGPMRAHLYGVYIATSILTTTGYQGFVVKSETSQQLIIILSIMGLYLAAIYASKILLLYYSHHIVLLDHQNATHALKKFLNVVGVNQILKKTIIKSYELKWERMKGQNIHSLIDPFNKPLQHDLLCDIYGKLLYRNSIFQNKSEMFYRNLLPHTQHEVIIKGGYLETINDIGEYTHVIYKGVAEALAADGTNLAILHPGSIFGNLENRQQTRAQISVVANTHVELISIKAIKFHEILNYFTHIKEEYNFLKVKYVSYIPSKHYEVMTTGASTDVDYKWSFFLETFNPNNKMMQIINALNIIYSCYLAILLQLYQMGSGEFSNLFIFLQYSSDILYTMHFLVKNRTAFEDKDGNLITDLNLVKKEHTKNSSRFWFAVCSIFPLDVLVLLLPIEYSRKYRLFSLLRFNRFLRLKYIFEYFETSKKKLNINMYAIRFGYVLLWGILALCGFACIISMLCYNLDVNIEPKIPGIVKIHSLDSLEKFKLFLTFLYMATHCITFTAQGEYYPQHEALIVCFICMMLICQNLYFIIFSEVFTLINESQFMKLQLRNKLNQLYSYMERSDVSISLTNRIQVYMQLFWLEQNAIQFPKLLEDAIPYLQDAVLNDAFSHLIIDHPIFVKCHRDCLRQIVQQMRTTTFFNGDFIQLMETIDETMYFVFDGEVAVLANDNFCKGDIVRTLKNGDSFGVLQGLYNNKPHIYTYCSMKRTIIVSLKFNSWKSLLNFYPATKELIYDAASIYTGL